MIPGAGVMRWRWVKDLKGPDGSVFLRRITILRIPRVMKIMVHRLTRPDYARELHDHPWAFVTIILSGGYVEECAGGVMRRRRVGRAYSHRAKFRHAIRELPKGTATTLVIRGPIVREWGFWTRCGWQGWREYCRKTWAGDPVCEDGD